MLSLRPLASVLPDCLLPFTHVGLRSFRGQMYYNSWTMQALQLAKASDYCRQTQPQP